MFLSKIKHREQSNNELNLNSLEHIIFENFDNGFKPEPVNLYSYDYKNHEIKKVDRPNLYYKLGLFEGQPKGLDMLVINKSYYIIADNINQLYRLVDCKGNIKASRINKDYKPFKSIPKLIK